MSGNHISLLEFYETHSQLAEGEVILDVRTAEEFNEAHIPQAINIPLDQLPHRSADLKNFKKIYIHCKRGGRARTGFDLLKSMGFDNILCVHDAGMDLWLEKGFPVKRN